MTTYRSKSEMPKRIKEPYVPEKIKLPDPDDYFKSADYIAQRVSMGDFDNAVNKQGKKIMPSTLAAVLNYLWLNTARNDMPGEIKGWVLTGKCNHAKIAAETGYSLRAVNDATWWLAENRWVWKLLDTKAGNKLSIKVLMDLEGHGARTGQRSDLVYQEHDLVHQAHDPYALSAQGLCTERMTIQGFSQGFNQDNNKADDVRGEASSGEDLDLDLDLLANILGVKSLRANIVSLATSLAASYGAAVVISVAERCRASARSNPAGLFVASANDMCDQHVAAKTRAEAKASQPDPDLQMHRVPDGVKVWGGSTRGATEKVAISNGRKQYRLSIHDGDKIGYVTPEHYEVLVEMFDRAA